MEQRICVVFGWVIDRWCSKCNGSKQCHCFVIHNSRILQFDSIQKSTNATIHKWLRLTRLINQKTYLRVQNSLIHSTSSYFTFVFLSSHLHLGLHIASSIEVFGLTLHVVRKFRLSNTFIAFHTISSLNSKWGRWLGIVLPIKLWAKGRVTLRFHVVTHSAANNFSVVSCSGTKHSHNFKHSAVEKKRGGG